MIDLRLPASIEGRTEEPFVARLSCCDDDEQSANLVGEFPDRLIFQWEGTHISLPNIGKEHLDGDVIFFDPERSLGHRWIRAQSSHNTFLVTERCDQLCVMCSQPPKKSHTDYFSYFRQAAELAPDGMTIGFSGGEPTLYKEQLFGLLETVYQRRPDLRFHILTNAQHFHFNDSEVLKSDALRNVLWGVPLYSNDPTLHDQIVSKEGAFETLCEGLSVLGYSGAAIELRTVLLKQNIEHLPNLAEFICDQLPFIAFWAIMQLENAGFAKRRWDGLFFDHSCEFTAIGQAIDFAHVRGVDVQLYNFPLCTVPSAYRDLAGATISDWKNKFLDKCEACTARDRCSGFFEWYVENEGYGEVQPI